MKSLDLQSGPNFTELLKAQKVAKHNKIMLTIIIRLPATISYVQFVTGILLIIAKQGFLNTILLLKQLYKTQFHSAA